MNANVLDKDWIDTREAAKLTGYAQEYIRQLARDNKIESTKIGTILMISRRSLTEYHQNKQGQKP